MKESTRVLVALIAAVLLGMIIGASGNVQLIGAADNLAPIGTLWVNAIRMTVIPLVVSLLITGVASASDVKAVGRIGRRSLIAFVLLSASVAVVMIPLEAALFSTLPRIIVAKPALPAGAVEAARDLSSTGYSQTVTGWLTSLIPTNPISAAANGAMLPLIVFTLLLAVAIALGTPDTRRPLVDFFRALADAMLTLVRWIILLAPIGVFALVLPLAAHAGGAMAGGIGFYVAAYSVGCITVILLLYPVVAVFGGIPVGRYARAALPPQLIALSSSSSIASLPALVESAERDLGLPSSITGFILPLAVSTFKIAAPVSWTSGALFVAWFYGIQLHAAQLAIIGAAAVFLSFGVPGIPRGAFIMLTPLFAAIGLPVEGIGILIAVDALPDLFATTLNVSGDLAAATLVARREGKV